MTPVISTGIRSPSPSSPPLLTLSMPFLTLSMPFLALSMPSLALPALLHGALILGSMVATSAALAPLSGSDVLRADTVGRHSSDGEALARVIAKIQACRDGCAGVVYVWSERMPLSRAGIEPIASAAEEVGVELTLLESELLAAYAAGEQGSPDPLSLGTGRPVTDSTDADRLGADHPVRDVRVADQLLASGALAHAPTLVVHAGGRVLGPAIYGYKTSGAYASALRRRLAEEVGAPPGEDRGAVRRPGLGHGDRGAFFDPDSSREPASRVARPLQMVAELEAVGRPGAYFRWVPGRQAVAYESRGDVYLLDLSDGESREAPGYVDFVPSPDGRVFVTPAPRRSGMEFYDAGEVFEAVDDGEPGRVSPIYTDRTMQDQYPSVGILEQDEATPREARSTVYRVLTSWFEGIRYRDYRVTGRAEGEPEIRSLGSRVEPCREKQLSIPIMSQDGGEVAARDESTGTTKIFRLLADGRCEEVSDLGVQTGKVAWHWSGRLLAFARPPLRARIGPGFMPGRPSAGSRSRARGGAPEPDLQAADGIFLYDRDSERMTRVPNSEDASSLAFPEFIGDDRLVYLVPGESGEPTVFRIVEGIR